MDVSNVHHVAIFEDDAGEWRWHGIAANNEIVAEGESHTREEDAARAARGVFGDQVVIVRGGRGSNGTD